MPICIMPPTRQPASALPLKPQLFLILLALADGEGHGYRIRKDVARLSDGAVRLDPGSLYRHIARLFDDGLIAEAGERPDSSLDDARRRYYRLTDAGRAALAAEADRMASLVAAVRATDAAKRHA